MNETINSLPIFAGISRDDIRDISANGFIKLYKNGDVLLKEGGKNNQFHIILSGIVKVIKGDTEREKILGFLHSGDFYGEMSLILNKPHTASIIAKEDTRILVFLEDEFEKYFMMNTIIIRNLLARTAERLAQMDIEVINLAYLTIQNRLMNFIWFITDKGSKNTDIGLTHHELAQIIGTNRETITKMLNELRNNGVISINREKRFGILDKTPFEV